MQPITIDQQRIVKVLERMMDMALEDPDNADMFLDGLEVMLESIAQDDGFGTERQTDPRGDGRDGDWSMNRVQGVDG